MTIREHILKLVPTGLLAIILTAFAACGGGVAQEEYDAAKAQLTQEQQKSTSLQQQLSSKVQEASQAQQQIAAKDKEIADLKARPSPTAAPVGTVAPASDARMLIGARGPIPTPTPAPPPPTATPLPAGATPPPRPQVPASYALAVPYTIYMETLATTRLSRYGYQATLNCLNTNVFGRGQRIVYRFEIVDTATGKRVTDADGATVTLRLPHGEEATARFSQRAGGRVPDAPWMWNTTWDIPPDYPLGGLDYEIIVTPKSGNAFTWKQPALLSKDLGLDTRLQVVQ